jgi:hypothetical protein
MQPENCTITIVFDPNFGRALREIACANPVWACESPSNREIAEELWAGKALGPDWVTIFLPQGSSPEDSFPYVLDNVDLHHQGWKRLIVIGIRYTAAVTSGLAEYGNGPVEETAAGFVFRRGE